jgi:PAS domain S-box-containing protein
MAEPTSDDLGDAKRVEAVIRDVEARSRVLLEIYEHAGESEEELVVRILEAAVALSGSEVGYLHFVHEDQQSLQLVAWSAGAKARCATVTASHYPLDQAGIWADCVRNRRAEIHNDYHTVEGRRGLPEGHFPVRRHLSVPVFEGERIAAVLGVGNKATDYSTGDANQLHLLANTLWTLALRKRAQTALGMSEALLRKVNGELEGRIQARTAELQRMMLMLKESESKFRALAESAPIHIQTLDAQGRITFMNQAALEFHGLASQEAAHGFDWRSRIHPDDLENHTPWTMAPGHGLWQEWEYRCLDAGGEYRWLLSRAVPEVGPRGALQGLIGNTIDITERLLQASRDRELEAAHAKSRIAAYLAHEINNPLMAINNCFRLIADHTPAGHPDRPFVDIMRKELVRIAGIVRTAYSLHRPGLPQVKETTVAETLLDLQALLQSKLSDREVTLEVEAADPSLRGQLPEELLRQVLFNLFQNALEVSLPGGRILCRYGREEGGLVLEVIDSGPGIAAEVAERIFEPGYTTKLGLETGGLGLGLATCRTLLESVGGAIGYRPADPGPGACFRIRIPWQG